MKILKWAIKIVFLLFLFAQLVAYYSGMIQGAALADYDVDCSFTKRWHLAFPSHPLGCKAGVWLTGPIE